MPYRIVRRIVSGSRRVLRCIAGIKKRITLKRVLLGFLLTFLMIIGINRVPSFVYNKIHTKEYQGHNLEFNSNYDNAVKTALETYPNEDFDRDGLLNVDDAYPFDADHDNNGIIDSDDQSLFLKPETFQVDNVKYSPTSNMSGVSIILDNYIFNNCMDQWVRITEGYGYPYAYYDNEWHSLDYQRIDEDILLYIPSDYCYIKMLDETSDAISTLYLFNSKFSYKSDTRKGKILDVLFNILYPHKSDCPYDIGCTAGSVEYFDNHSFDVIGSGTVTTVNEYNLSRFKQMPINLDDLSIIYNSIKSGKSVVLSIQSVKGEALVIAYGYDLFGNLYVADYNNPDNIGMLNVKPYTCLIQTKDGYVLKSNIDISGMGLSKDDKVCLIR